MAARFTLGNNGLSLLSEICDYKSETSLIDKDGFISFFKQLNQVCTEYVSTYEGGSGYPSNNWYNYIQSGSSPATPFVEDTRIYWRGFA